MSGYREPGFETPEGRDAALEHAQEFEDAMSCAEAQLACALVRSAEVIASCAMTFVEAAEAFVTLGQALRDAGLADEPRP